MVDAKPAAIEPTTVRPTTIGACVEQGARRFREAKLFFGHGTDNAEDEALWLVLYALSLSYDIDDSVFAQTITEDEWSAIDDLFSRRITQRIPAAYLTGQGWFCGYSFIVNPAVLVPRSPIAELIQQQFQPWLSQQPTRVLDMCTGCGCIGIATALSFPMAIVDLSDISKQALDVAQQNIQQYQLEARVNTFCSDVFSQLPSQQYDLIISNPPYVDAGDLSTMPDEYHAEPTIALSSGDDGLNITRSLLRHAAEYLTADGVMIVEVGNSWVNLEAAFPRIPFLWMEFAHGGHGVFLISRKELVDYREDFL